MKLLFGIVCSLILIGLPAQDGHFSNPMQTPTTFNPARTGSFNGCYRISSNYRNQWLLTGSPTNTFVIAFDEPMKIARSRNTRIGVGFHILQDISAGSLLNHSDLKLNLALHRFLDYDKKHRLSLGFHSGIVQTKVNINELGFEEQFNSVSAIDLDRNNGENFQTGNLFALDHNIGLYYLGIIKKINFSSDFSVHHINTPHFSLFNEQTDSSIIRRKYNMTLNIEKELNSKSILTISNYNQIQSGNRIIIIGGSMIYKDLLINGDKNAVELGLYYRYRDAFILNFKTKIKEHSFNFSYDITTSGFAKATRTFGALELGYTRNIQCKPQLPNQFTRPCLRL